MARKIRIVLNSSRPKNAPKPVPLSAILGEAVQRRFWAKVDIGTPDVCWPFTASRTDTGYGVVNISLGYRQPKKVRAHVFALMSHTKQQNTMDVLHSLKCTTKLCCNPHHLRWGTRSENALDARDTNKIGNQKLTWEDVDDIRILLAEGYPQAGIGILFGVDQCTVSEIKLGKKWNEATRRTAA